MTDLLIEMSTKEKWPKAKQCVHLLRLTNTEPLSVCNNNICSPFLYACICTLHCLYLWGSCVYTCSTVAVGSRWPSAESVKDAENSGLSALLVKTTPECQGYRMYKGIYTIQLRSHYLCLLTLNWAQWILLLTEREAYWTWPNQHGLPLEDSDHTLSCTWEEDSVHTHTHTHVLINHEQQQKSNR